MGAVFVTFQQLMQALEPFHRGRKDDIARLHDVWKKGAPSPDSIVRNPVGYDERKVQVGNVEKRLLLPTPFTQWVVEISVRDGYPLSYEQAYAILTGEARYHW